MRYGFILGLIFAFYSYGWVTCKGYEVATRHVEWCISCMGPMFLFGLVFGWLFAFILAASDSIRDLFY
jgi:hypothetical protein